MGKLNIAHHKSYHPYRRDNIERVRQDEEEARLKEAKEEGRMMLADSEARIDALRQRAGLSDREREQLPDSDEPANQEQITAVGELPTTNGHINLFHDVEQNMVAALTTARKTDSKASERGVKLAPDEKELRRWYTRQRAHDDSQPEEGDDEKRKRDAQRKYKNDPLTVIEQQLASRSSLAQPHPRLKPRRSYPPASSTSSSSGGSSLVQARIQRESSERERALALIQRKKKELEGNMTPSTVCNDNDDGYRDMYNRREVQDAHRGREQKKHRDRRREW
ncbi:hypothetical protein P691DRAFT_713179 [Macrolepiota fuliginosa MF-IS2]|uniref:CBF1-interacting co-repressor CIR N-terminal domain-containing protein n=1 Tax=Macrolepiota fuliginosa MF-IS2 TaxID=1400762 RepID=A0A9P5X5E3_9AGAR|nr:hypothetical protein P691DRAFT_713179 [Macrolepiota fuliginosa MF-IS2]